MEKTSIRDLIYNNMDNLLGQIYKEMNITTGNITPFQTVEWDGLCDKFTSLFCNLIEQNGGPTTTEDPKRMYTCGNPYMKERGIPEKCPHGKTVCCRHCERVKECLGSYTEDDGTLCPHIEGFDKLACACIYEVSRPLEGVGGTK